MVQTNARKQGEGHANETGSFSSGGAREGWESVLDLFIKQIEIVSRHFNYTEEYVMDHSPQWLSRKVKQAQSDMFEDHNAKVLEGFQSALLLLDAVFNKGREFNKILPPSIEAAMEHSKHKAEIESKFVTSQWWKGSGVH